MKIVYLLITIAFLTSCSDIYFTEPQPIGGKNLNSFPDAITGEYRLPVVKRNMIIEKNKITDADGKETFLSDSLIVRKLNDYYVINMRSDGEKNKDLKGAWNVFLMKTNDCNNLEIIDFTLDKNEETINYYSEKYDGIVIKDEPLMLNMDVMEDDDIEMLEESEMEVMEESEPLEESKTEVIEEEEMEMNTNIEAIILDVTKKEFVEFIKSEKVGNPIILKNIKNN